MAANALLREKRFGSTVVALLACAFALAWAGSAGAATINVDTTDDELNADVDCSLREAIQAANTDGAVDACTAGSGDDTIVVPAGSYVLTTGAPLNITSNVTIDGPGADQAEIDGNSATKVILITGGATAVTIEGVKILDGNSSDSGGGIDFDTSGVATLNLTEVEITYCSTLGNGGGVFVQGQASAKTLNMRASTVSLCSASGEGGGINIGADNSATIVNSTIANNTANDDGGGIRAHGRTAVVLNNVTIAGNSTDFDTNGSGEGGGIRRDPETPGTFTVANTIIADNTDPSTAPDCSGTFTSGGSNIIADPNGCVGFTDASDQTGVDPNLAPLGDYGGPTQTIGPNSLADPPVDNGGDVTPCELTDQRGVPRPQSTDCDVGALELGQCGDSILCDVDGCIPLEECDDGNIANGDCCSSTCQFESLGSGCGDPNQPVNECNLTDTCDGSGNCLANLADPNTTCGDSSEDECDHADNCSGTGDCLDNLEAIGTTCTDPNSLNCNNAVCDGSGNCDDNLPPFWEMLGTPCGDPNTDTDCDNPDSCDSSGTCLSNYELLNTPCTDDGNVCTNDGCDGSGLCTHPNAPNGQACTTDGNECTDDECYLGACSHPDSPAGQSCTDDGNDCTDDECNGSGTCTHPDLAAGTLCGDGSDTDCDNPDECNGSGTCEPLYEPADTPCTDDGDICTEDVCDGSGMCLHTLIDTDGDGVCDGIEESCFSGDSTIPNSTALPTATGLPGEALLGCVRVETDCAQHRNVMVHTEEELGNDPDYAYAYGLVRFRLEGCPQTNSVTAHVIETFYDSTDPLAPVNLEMLTLRKYGPIVPGVPPFVFYTLIEENPATGVTVAGGTFEFDLFSNQTGSNTTDPNIIIDDNGPGTATSEVPAPALSPFGLAAGLLILVGAAGLAIRRTRRFYV